MLYVASLVDPSTIASGGGPSGYAVVGLFLGGGGGLGNARGSSEDHLLETKKTTLILATLTSGTCQGTQVPPST